MMHTTEYKLDDSSLSRVWVIHNSDFSGDCIVGFAVDDRIAHYEWTVPGDELLSGDFAGTPIYMLNGDTRPVPYWVVGRAVTTALRYRLTSKIVSFMKDL